ncbi:leucine-rich repeats and immunoglobulin-like domains protein 1 isoform X2 [Mya arenaria]|nr:leucine-rich repeats and immunoglobulin-like domains protein 1 isoform X2 [Mya arenaria]
MLPSLPSSFVLNGDCIAPAPCTCSGSNINCQGRNLQTIPQFRHSNISSNSNIYFNLQENNITTIGSNAFCNITLSKFITVGMKVYSTHMNSMSSNAFNCIGANIVYLDMAGNSFSVLPQALKQLVNLTYLDIDQNPLTTLDSGVISVIGSTLQTLFADLSHFTTWPHEFRFLRAIDTLTIKRIPFSRLSTDAFHGMESTLQSLTISYSHLERMPITICHLQNLNSLAFSNNHYLNLNSTFIEPCNKSLNSVTALSLGGNDLKNFPDVFHNFPEIAFLDLRYNKLRLINGDSIPANNRLQILYLSSNNFSRIPDAVNKLQHVTQLRMEHNHIDAIYDTDLQTLTGLTHLFLYKNSLEFISSHAFKNNPKLYYLQLNSNLLRTISSSITALRSLNTLNLRDNHIECSCALSHLQSWNVASINFLIGNCDSSNETLKHFLMNALPGCP